MISLDKHRVIQNVELKKIIDSGVYIMYILFLYIYNIITLYNYVCIISMFPQQKREQTPAASGALGSTAASSAAFTR